MASVQSLGVHRPTALPFLTSEGILPPEPPQSAYAWQAYSHRTKHGDAIEDELVYTSHCLVWSRGGVIQRVFRFDIEKEAISHAIFTQFAVPPEHSKLEGASLAQSNNESSLYKTSHLKTKRTRAKANHLDSQNDHIPISQGNTNERILEGEDNIRRALVVVLKTQAHIYLLSQTAYIVHLPFAVNSVSPSFLGLIFQRKVTEEKRLQPNIKVPPAPQNTFSYSQSTFANAHASFSTLDDVLNPVESENLDPLFSPLVEKLQETSGCSETPEIPGLFCLVDPLTEVGAVVTRIKSSSENKSGIKHPVSSPYVSLDPNEKLLYISPQSEVSQRSEHLIDKSPLLLAVTENQVERSTTLWTVTYVDQHSVNSSQLHILQSSKNSGSRRRSSFASRLSTGATTPVARSHPLANKDPVLEEEASSLDQDLFGSIFDPKAPTKSSRRVSSLVARADLSQDRTTFTDLASSHLRSKRSHRGPSFGTRASYSAHDEDGTGGIKPRHFHDIRSSIEPSSTDMLDNFENVHDLTLLDDSERHLDTHGLRREIVFQRIYTLSHEDNQSPGPSEYHDGASHVFTMQAPELALGDPSHSPVLILCVMNRSIGELLIFQIKYAPSINSLNQRPSSLPKAGNYGIKAIGTRRSGITDACKISQGMTNRILVLDGRANTLTLQAPWTTLAKVELPNPLSVHYPFQIVKEDSPGQIREGSMKRVISQGPKAITCLENTTFQGCVDIMDSEGLRHRLKVYLRPSDPFVSRMIDLCEVALPNSETYGEAMLRGWWDAMSWLGMRNEDIADKEWTALILVLFSMVLPFIDDQRPETPVRQKKRKVGFLRSSSGANTDLESWDEMWRNESSIFSTSPEWAEQEAWKWIKSTGDFDSTSSKMTRSSTSATRAANVPVPKQSSYIFDSIGLARSFTTSALGQAAIGKQGYLPTAVSRDPELRRTAVAKILIALHLLREELKLDALLCRSLHLLTPILAQIGTWLHWQNWSCSKASFYMLESVHMDSFLFDESVITGLKVPAEPFSPPSILKHIESSMVSRDVKPFTSLIDVIGSPSTNRETSSHTYRSMLQYFTPRTIQVTSLLRAIYQKPIANHVSWMEALGVEASVLETLPESIAGPFRTVISSVQSQPLGDLSDPTLRLIGREDIAMLAGNDSGVQSGNRLPPIAAFQVLRDVHNICNQAFEVEGIGPYDGSAELDRQNITRLLFKEDQRFAEAAKMVHPLHYPLAHCIPELGWSEADFLEAQQDLAKIVALRTLSVSLGRALLFYSARLPLLTEKFPVHGFTLSCVMKPSDTTVTADRAVFTEEKVSWAFFHAGAEAGLSISREAKGIDTSWILYNKPRDLTNRHAGFLLALGLNGHLKSIAKWVAFKYLTPKHNMTSIGLLLGLSASYVGTMDTLVTRLLSVHVIRMLPPGAAELNLSPLTQTCGLMGMGLLYCHTQHRRMTEIMLSEIENQDLESNTNPQETLRDEGYRLAAGFALGYINLGQGKDLKGLHDMHITERLLTLAIATKRVKQIHITDKATAGATVSIALIFMKTNDEALARKIDVPDTSHQFDYVRPDQFLLRTVAKHLIMWDNVQADHTWMTSQIPHIYNQRSLSNIRSLISEDLPFFNILAGLCLSIGLKHAGTGVLEVRDVLCSYLDQFIRLCRLPALNYDGKLTRITVRNCQDIVALSASCVMAGRGDLAVLRRLRSLHGRTDAETPYGSHLAAHFAIGMLFLGGGTYTLGTSNLAIASLLCAFYPLLPASVLDNKSHLQAFRHFWVLATERRCLVPRDIDTHRPFTLPVVVRHKSGARTQLTAPCLLPELSTVTGVHTQDPDYWPVSLDLASNPSHLSAFLRHQSIYLRRRGVYDASQSSVFSATMQALNDTQTAHQLRNQPFDWLFNLPAFCAFDETERALLLPADGASVASGVSKMLRGTIVDDRLMVETGCLGDGRSERLWNLRLLLKWAEESEKRGEGIGWLGKDVIERLRARLVLWARERA